MIRLFAGLVLFYLHSVAPNTTTFGPSSVPVFSFENFAQGAPKEPFLKELALHSPIQLQASNRADVSWWVWSWQTWRSAQTWDTWRDSQGPVPGKSRCAPRTNRPCCTRWRNVPATNEWLRVAQGMGKRQRFLFGQLDLRMFIRTSDHQMSQGIAYHFTKLFGAWISQRWSLCKTPSPSEDTLHNIKAAHFCHAAENFHSGWRKTWQEGHLLPSPEKVHTRYWRRRSQLSQTGWSTVCPLWVAGCTLSPALQLCSPLLQEKVTCSFKHCWEHAFQRHSVVKRWSQNDFSLAQRLACPFCVQ